MLRVVPIIFPARIDKDENIKLCAASTEKEKVTKKLRGSFSGRVYLYLNVLFFVSLIAALEHIGRVTKCYSILNILINL